MNGAGDFNERSIELLTPFGWPAALFVSILAVAGVALSIRGLHAYLGPWRRRTLAALRSAAALALIAVFFEPAVVYKKVSTVRSRLSVLVDESASMSLPAVHGGASRHEEAASWLAGSRAALDVLAGRFVLEFSTFDAEARRVPPASLLDGGARRPAGAGTDILRALESAVGGELPLSGLLLVTDGLDRGALAAAYNPESGELAPHVRAFLQKMGVPVHVVIPGRRGAIRDVAVVSVDAPAVSFAGVETEVSARIAVTGYDGAEMPVTLRENGAVAATAAVRAVPGRSSYSLRFRFTPRPAAAVVVSVSIPAPAGDAVPGNNTAHAVMKVSRDRVRVLQVAGGPSWDVRFLRQYFKRTPGTDLISFFILRTNDSRVNAPEDEISLIPFPTDEVFSEHLSTFDAVFFQDFNFTPYGLRGYLPGLVRFVMDGGGLMIIGGNRSLSTGEYRASEIDQILPLTLATGDAAISAEEFGPVLSAAGRRHPVTVLSADPRENEAMWKGVRALSGLNLSIEARPGAQVLLEHPFRRLPDGTPAPLLAVREAGRGRVALLMTDESWRWEFSEPAQGEARVYSRLYENMLRWLTGDPAMRRMAMETRAETVPGAGARINGRILGPDYSPLPGAKVGLVLRRDDAAPVRLEAETGPDGFYSAPVQALPPGVYEAEAVAAAGGAEPGTLRQAVLVDTGDPELMGAAPDAALMGAVAAVSGGRLSYTADAPLEKLAFPDRSQEVVSRKEHGTLWDRMWIILAISIVLASEWALRRRWGQQ